MRKASSNFSPAFSFLPPREREALSAVYAFARAIDDVVDVGDDPGRQREELEGWRQGILGCFNGGAPKELAKLAEAIRRYEIPQGFFLDLLKGVEMDLTKGRYKTFGELERYCYLVAGTVGLICNRIFQAGSFYDEAAVQLGTAFQLINIVRDVGSDLTRGRIYLPLEDLSRFSYSTEELEKRVVNENFLRLMSFEAARARGYLDLARKVFSCRSERRLFPALVMTRVYEAILSKIEREGFPSLTRTVRLSVAEKFRLAATMRLRFWLS